MNNKLALREDMQLSELGNVLVRSGFFQDAKDASQAIVKVLAGRELGFGPIASMTGVNIIKGRVSLSANLIAAAIKRSGKYNYRVAKLSEEECLLIFFEGQQEVGRSSFTSEDAKRAGLAGDNWSKYRRNMNFARALSNGAKWYCPDIFGGPVYTPDELGAVVDGETGEVIEGSFEPEPEQHDTGETITEYREIKPRTTNITLVGWDAWDKKVAIALERGVPIPKIDETTVTKDQMRAAYDELLKALNG